MAARPRVTRVFRSCCQMLVRNVVRSFDEEASLGTLVIGLGRSRDRAAHALGISRTSVHKLTTGFGPIPDPGDEETRDRAMMIDEADLAVIRPALVHLIVEKLPVTLDSLRARIVAENPDWKWSRSTLQRALHTRLGIHFDVRKHGYYERLREDPENMRRRALYPKFLFEYERDQRPFVFVDESWINRNSVPLKIWTDGSLEFEPPVPPGKGQRWIIIGAGTRSGWVQESVVMWKGNVASEDYHTEMNSDVFSHWLVERLLPNIDRRL